LRVGRKRIKWFLRVGRGRRRGRERKRKKKILL
jgi:hypothetical protein